MRTKAKPKSPDSPPLATPIVINPNSVFTAAQARAALGLAKATIAREIRLGRLRVSKRAGRHFIKGEWLIEWIAAGEITPRRPEQSATPEEQP